jgi:dTDP-4-dehydrorhamnose 3,5-epimerase
MAWRSFDAFALTSSTDMRRIPTRLDGLVLLEPVVHGDERGFFMETYRQDAWAEHGVTGPFVQDNHSRSRRGTVRGVHFQTSPGQGKLVRVARGTVWDVIVDLRRDSPTFKRWHGVELTADNRRALYIAEGLAHGFQTLTDDAELLYLISEFYYPDAARGVRWDDPAFGIEWPLPNPRISERDRNFPRLAG